MKPLIMFSLVVLLLAISAWAAISGWGMPGLFYGWVSAFSLLTAERVLRSVS